MGKEKNFKGGGGSTMDDAMYLRPDTCILRFLNSDKSLNLVFFMGSDASIAKDHLLIVLLVYCLLHCIGIVLVINS